MSNKETADLSAEELQKRIAELEAEIAKHTIVNSLLAGDELEVALANKVFQQVGRIKELKSEVATLKELLTETQVDFNSNLKARIKHYLDGNG